MHESVFRGAADDLGEELDIDSRGAAGIADREHERTLRGTADKLGEELDTGS